MSRTGKQKLLEILKSKKGMRIFNEEGRLQEEGFWNYAGESGEWYWTGEKGSERIDHFCLSPPTEEEKEIIKLAEQKEFEQYVEQRSKLQKEKRKQKKEARKAVPGFLGTINKKYPAISSCQTKCLKWPKTSARG